MKKIIIYTDGASKGNPGPSAIGVVICNEKNQEIKKYSEFLGPELTNNTAEYQAVIFALKKVKALFGKKLAKKMELEIRSDSELLVKQINGLYKVLEPNIGKLFLLVWNLKLDFKKTKFRSISRRKNTEADRLANEALKESGTEQKSFE